MPINAGCRQKGKEGNENDELLIWEENGLYQFETSVLF